MPVAPPRETRKDAAYKRAVDMLRKAPLVDGHNDLAWVVRTSNGGDLATFDLTRVHPETDTDIPRLKAGMVNTQVLAAYLPTEIAHPATVTLEQIDLIRRIEARHADVFLPVRRASDIATAKKKQKIGSLISVEGTVGCEGSLSPLRMWHQLGVRLVTLCHNGSLPWIDSSTDAPRAEGALSPFGRALVSELNRLGIIIDASHASVASAQAVVETSRAPVILSHSNCAALCPHPRNAPDDLIKAVAARGGIIMATFVPEFINPELWARKEAETRARWRHAPPEELKALWQQMRAAGPLPAATLSGVCDHIDYMLGLVGPDHVGIGSDFFGGENPQGLEDCSTFPGLFAELIRRGHGEQVLARLAGANFLRVMRKVERIGRAMQKEEADRPTKGARRKPRARPSTRAADASGKRAVVRGAPTAGGRK